MKFKLDKHFIEKYSKIKPEFGYEGLGELAFRRTYSRIKEDGTNEEWYEVIQRVVEGTYNMQKDHIMKYNLGWDEEKAQRSAQEMYYYMFTFKFLPAGRGLWAMGTELTEKRHLFAALNSCAFVSTKNLATEFVKPFTFTMDFSMLGVGVGFDSRGANTITIKNGPKKNKIHYEIEDSREGWVESLRLILMHLMFGESDVIFNYSKIRKAGLPIKGFGGIASGPQPLKDLHNTLRELLQKENGNKISDRVIVDIMNLIGQCVIAGNVRRSAEIAIGDPNSRTYLDLKNYDKNPERASIGWVSNNSISAELGMDYTDIVKRIKDNGEPGLIWLDNARMYSRMDGMPDYKDHKADGVNPCSEQTLESYELCCLVEQFPSNCKSDYEQKRALKYAYLYAKTVTLGTTHDPFVNRVLMRNRRIGTSMSGVVQFVATKGIGKLLEITTKGYKDIQYYDEIYSDWLAIPRSKKTTSVKPSGTVSLLAGVTPGIHYPESSFYIRRIRLSKSSPLLEALKKANLPIEDNVVDPSSVVVTFPIGIDERIPTLKDITMYDQLNMTAFMQRYWADNQVSSTVTFKPEEAKYLKNAIDIFQYQLKGISFLPKTDLGSYPQMPYEEITKEEYLKIKENIKPIIFNDVKNNKVEVERFCTNDTCTI